VLKIFALIILGIAVPAIAQADRLVRFTGDFESGIILPNGGDTDSFFVRTLPDPQIGNEVINTGAGGGDESSSWDSKVVTSVEIGGEIVTPRNGRFFAQHVLHYDKDYTGLNSGQEKARAEFGLYHDANRIDFDTETYVGFSIFIPSNYEHETGTKGNLGSETLVNLNSDSSATFFTLRVYVPKGENEAHWFFNYQTNPDSVEESGRHGNLVDLGPINLDKGKWTDYVIRFRSNPFPVTTNPAAEGIANANNRVYEGNKGILQLWKAEGPNDIEGNRRMFRKISLVDTPVGNVPGDTQGKSKLAFSMRIYKYNWQTFSTDVKGPILLGFDEFRFGEFNRNGTGYSDVHPTELPCTDGCPAVSGQRADLTPEPPTRPTLTVN